jgi:hypothetical protein
MIVIYADILLLKSQTRGTAGEQGKGYFNGWSVSYVINNLYSDVKPELPTAF